MSNCDPASLHTIFTMCNGCTNFQFTGKDAFIFRKSQILSSAALEILARLPKAFMCTHKILRLCCIVVIYECKHCFAKRLHLAREGNLWHQPWENQGLTRLKLSIFTSKYVEVKIRSLRKKWRKFKKSITSQFKMLVMFQQVYYWRFSGTWTALLIILKAYLKQTSTIHLTRKFLWNFDSWVIRGSDRPRITNFAANINRDLTVVWVRRVERGQKGDYQYCKMICLVVPSSLFCFQRLKPKTLITIWWLFSPLLQKSCNGGYLCSKLGTFGKGCQIL